jgi:hypothetical protein
MGKYLTAKDSTSLTSVQMKFMIDPPGSFMTSEVNDLQTDGRARWTSKLDRFRQTARQFDRQIVSICPIASSSRNLEER